MTTRVNLTLTRRNLLSLLAKLDKNQVKPDTSWCTLVKSDTVHSTFPLKGADEVWVQAVEDDEYYIERTAGITMEDLENG